MQETIETWIATLKALPGYPWLPCPICKSDEGCDHPVPERARAAIPGLVLPVYSSEPGGGAHQGKPGAPSLPRSAHD